MRALLLAPLALALACAGAPPSAGPPEGGRLFRSKCSGCHRAYPPEERTRAQWAEVMTRMAPKAHLQEEERAVLLWWLDARAKDASPPAARPAPER